MGKGLSGQRIKEEECLQGSPRPWERVRVCSLRREERGGSHVGQQHGLSSVLGCPGEGGSWGESEGRKTQVTAARQVPPWPADFVFYSRLSENSAR